VFHVFLDDQAFSQNIILEMDHKMAWETGNMPIVYSTHPVHPDVARKLCLICDFRIATAPTPAVILKEGVYAEIILVSAPIPEEYFTNAPHLRAAVRHGSGLDMIPVKAATLAGVIVANAPGANSASVAEHVIFVSIALLRNFRPIDTTLREQGWHQGRKLAERSHDLGGRKLGLLGFGNIGRALLPLATAFGMRVAATTRRPEALPASIEALVLDDLMAQCDVIVVCCPLNDSTRGLVSAQQIKLMKREAVLINVARGPIVDTAALISALQWGRIAGAALDVFDTQPLPRESALFEMSNLILTPHIAALTEESMFRMGDVSASEIIRILSGNLPINFCNPEVATFYRQRFGNLPTFARDSTN